MRRVANIKRAIAGLSALVLSAVALAPALTPQKASAYGLITERQVKMSSSALAAASTSYYVEFKPATSGFVKSIAVDFCQNSPILGDSCTSTAGTNTPTITSATVVTDSAGLGNLGTGLTWTVTVVNSNHTFTIANATGINMTAGVAYYFTINAITNPTDMDTGTGGNQVGTFYARVLTFPNDATSNYAGGYTGGSANLASNVPTDAGGIALSTANQITIQSKVQERLTFCIYTTGASCPGSISNPVILGDTNGVLDPSTQYSTSSLGAGQPKFGLSSNAASGVIVRMKGGTLKRTSGCADGTSQPCSIDPVGSSAVAGSVGSEQFGLRVVAAGPAVAAVSPYNGASNNYAFDDNNTTGTQSTYGQSIAQTTTGSAQEQGTLEFVGNISNTTESGIYTTTLTFIATGKY